MQPQNMAVDGETLACNVSNVSYKYVTQSESEQKCRNYMLELPTEHVSENIGFYPSEKILR